MSDIEHEAYYLLMMGALDDELDAEQTGRLQAHLLLCPPCQREWHALTAIDRLLREAPMLMPAADFAQRALARLPDRHYRAWLLAGMYLVLLLSGVLPLLAGVWLVAQYGVLVQAPGVLGALLRSLAHTAEVIGTVVGALLSSAGRFVLENPPVLGWLFVMVGLVALWSGVYRQVLGVQFSPVRTAGNGR